MVGTEGGEKEQDKNLLLEDVLQLRMVGLATNLLTGPMFIQSYRFLN